MRHEEHVTGFVVVVVQCEEINLAEHSTGANYALTIDKEIVAKNVDKDGGIRNLTSGSNCGVELGRDRFPAIFFQNLDHGSRLHYMNINKRMRTNVDSDEP
jgi:hypothetical protein